MKAVAAVRDSQTGGCAKQSLFFPAGRYRVSQPIFLDHWSGGGFFGEGPDQSVIVSSSGKSVFRTTRPSIAMKYNAGGSVVFLNCALGGRAVYFSVSIGGKALILDTRSKNTSSHSVGGNAKAYFVSP